jgi:hypothetical protein
MDKIEVTPEMEKAVERLLEDALSAEGNGGHIDATELARSVFKAMREMGRIDG